MTTDALVARIANLIPEAGLDPFAQFSARMADAFVNDLTLRRDQFPKTVTFMQSLQGRAITDADNETVANLYAEEASAVRAHQ